MRYFQFTSLFLLTGFLVSGSLRAQTIRQQSTTEGLSFGLQGHYMSWSSDYFQFLDERSGSGIGISGRVGYGFNQRFDVFAQYDFTPLKATPVAAQSFHFAHATAGVRFNFSTTTHALRPFAEVGYAYQTGKADQVLNQNGGRDNLLFKGGAVHIGAGLNYFIALPIAITLTGSLQAGAKSPVYVNGFDTGDKADVRAFRISAGVVVYLSELF